MGRKLSAEHCAKMRMASLSPETHLKRSIAQKGHTVSEETRKKISIAKKGRRVSDQVRSKISATMKGHKKSAETRAKMSAAKKGHVVSAETRRKLSAKNRGRVPTIEQRRKISNALMGHTVSEETRKKIGIKHKGMGHSVETRARMSASQAIAITQGRYNRRHRHYKSGSFYSQKNDKNFHYRSSLELLWLNLLEDDPDVKYYEVEPVHIPYKWARVERKYVPDIQVQYFGKQMEILEIKPEHEYFRKDAKNLAKWAAAKLWCEERGITFCIVGYKELTEPSISMLHST